MTRLWFDLLVLAAVSREMAGLWETGAGPLPQLGLGLAALSFLLGLAPADSETAVLVLGPLRRLLRGAIALLLLAFYGYLVSIRGSTGSLATAYAASLACYSAGRLARCAWRTVLAVAGVALGLHWFVRLLAPHLGD